MSSIRHALGFTQELTPITARVESATYRDFIRSLPCVVRGHTGTVEAAHVSSANLAYGHTGRAMGRKASDRWCLPLCYEEHAIQTALGNSGNGERSYWAEKNINPWALCNALYGAWNELGAEKAHAVCVEIIKRNTQ